VVKRASEEEEVSFLLLDLARIILDAGHAVDIPVQFTGVHIPHLELYFGMKDCSKLVFRDCYISKLDLDPDVSGTNLPRFVGCYVAELEGRASRRDLPVGVFDDECVFDKFTQAPDTTNAIGAMDLPLGGRVLLTVLRKVFMQSGRGRKENALHRGLDHQARRLVSPILRLLQAEKLISPYRRAGLDMTIWVPDRGKMARVAKIVTSPHTCNDPLLSKASDLS
jgi:hypothetical protein